MIILFDVFLVLMLLGLALYAAAMRDNQSAIIGFVAFGLLLSIGWTRLASIDVALTEAAIGSGVTGLLLLRAEAYVRGSISDRTFGLGSKMAIAVLCASVSAALAYIVLTAPFPAPTLAPASVASLDSAGLGNSVTAVLMAYRAIDTLLEKVVLILALVGVWSLTPNRYWGGAAVGVPTPAPEPLVFLARTLPPIGVVVAVYLLWVGADAPGGTFQGGAVLAAMWLLGMSAGLLPIPQTQARTLRLLLVGGPMVFLVIGFLGLAAGAFLAYPAAIAKLLIIIIEMALILSIAITLGMLVVGSPKKVPST
ncbi:MAG: Na(+)/H(+) antiporter subunit B [Hyphomicrobiaceae bacterium]